ncbi:hypothetical protein V1506DRAFT_562906 [Lipomyces tetrasporus]
MDDFDQTNISGTLLLLEAATTSWKCEVFIFTSTTSTFGRALASNPGQSTTWIDEPVVSIPKNIYGVTKAAAEDMCELVQMQTNMSVLVVGTSRFFSEADDVKERRDVYDDNNLKSTS